MATNFSASTIKSRRKISNDAAAAFVTMIEIVESLTASNFLNQLYALEGRNWVYAPTSESNIDVGPDSHASEAIAIATVFSAFSSPGPDETEYIRNTFFRKIGHPVKLQNRRDHHGRLW